MARLAGHDLDGINLVDRHLSGLVNRSGHRGKAN